VFALLAGILILASGCGKKTDETVAANEPDSLVDAQAYYEANPDFFHFKTPADIPADLKWEDGMDLPEFASPDAKKGGTVNYWVQDFPRTLRIVGPDSNGSFRPWILDDNVMTYAQRHPNDTALTPDGFKHFPGLADRWALDRETK